MVVEKPTSITCATSTTNSNKSYSQVAEEVAQECNTVQSKGKYRGTGNNYNNIETLQ